MMPIRSMLALPVLALLVLGVLPKYSAVLAQDSPTTAPTTQPSAPPLSGALGKTVALFNGKDLNDWVWFQPAPPGGGAAAAMADVWTIRDGILHDRGTPTGYIRTQTPYDNYVLTVEQRHLSKGNGGILFAITGPDKLWPHGLECQTLNGEEGDLRGIANFKLALDPARTEPKRLRCLAAGREKPVGQWETFVITVDHGNIAVTLNGQLQNITATSDSLAGQIGLQAEGGEMEFRKVEVAPIENP